MRDGKPTPDKNCRRIVSDPDLLGGKLAVRDTRLSVSSSIVACLAEGMDPEEIAETYVPFPREALPEALNLAAEFLGFCARAVRCE